MSKEVRAVVLGLTVVVLAALALSFWRRPAPEFRRIREFRIEVVSKEGDATRRASFRIPAGLVARVARLTPLEEIGGNVQTDWGHGEVSASEILEAARNATPGSPGRIEKEDSVIEVQNDGASIEIDVKDDWDKHVHVRLPRIVIESFSDDQVMSVSEILHGLDELGPGDMVVIRDKDTEVTITAVPRKKALEISASAIR